MGEPTLELEKQLEPVIDKLGAKVFEEKWRESEDRVMKRLEERMTKEMPNRFTPGGEVKSESGFKSFGEFLRAVKGSRSDSRLKALGEGTDSAGGFLVPEEFKATLLARSLERSLVRPYATKIPMRTDTINIPKVVDTTHASNLYGGIIAYWLEEAGSKTLSEPVFGNVKLIAKKLTGYTYASDELLADSAIALESLLAQQFGAAISWFEDLAFLRGTGVGEPYGIHNSGAVIDGTRAPTTATVSLADLSTCMSRLYPDSLYAPSTIWIMSPAVLTQLIQLVSTVITWMPVGTGGGMVGGGAATRIPATIMGMPYRVTEKMPTLGTQGDIGLYDLSYYLIGDRQDLRIDTSTHARFTTDETAWRFVERVDGQSWVDSAFTPYNSGATLSPYVQLITSTT